VRTRVLLTVLVAGLLASAGIATLRPGAVLGSCAGVPQPPEEAVLFGDVVFVGTVLRTENQGRWATVRVEERWSGARDLPETVEVRGGPEPGTASSVDRTFQPGRYLFIVRQGGGFLVDDACSSTTPWTEELGSLRPADVTPAAEELPTDPFAFVNSDAVPVVAALLVALLVAIVAYLWVLRARRRPPDWIR